jgi:adenosylhomocysteinase
LNVEVVESDPVRRLYAHYDGFPVPSLAEGLKRAGIVVTATGTPGAVSVDDLAAARSGVVLLNAGHGGDEIDVEGIKHAAEREDHIANGVVRYRLPDGPAITLLGDGHPLNIVLNSGSPEPVLLHFAVLGLTLEWLAGEPDGLVPGEIVVPERIEARAAQHALDALESNRG